MMDVEAQHCITGDVLLGRLPLVEQGGQCCRCVGAWWQPATGVVLDSGDGEGRWDGTIIRMWSKKYP